MARRAITNVPKSFVGPSRACGVSPHQEDKKLISLPWNNKVVSWRSSAYSGTLLTRLRTLASFCVYLVAQSGTRDVTMRLGYGEIVHN